MVADSRVELMADSVLLTLVTASEEEVAEVLLDPSELITDVVLPLPSAGRVEYDLLTVLYLSRLPTSTDEYLLPL